MQLSATFTQLAVSLGHIFKCEISDIDMRDVVLNRRILVVNLPTLENSGEATACCPSRRLRKRRSSVHGRPRDIR